MSSSHHEGGTPCHAWSFQTLFLERPSTRINSLRWTTNTLPFDCLLCSLNSCLSSYSRFPASEKLYQGRRKMEQLRIFGKFQKAIAPSKFEKKLPSSCAHVRVHTTFKKERVWQKGLRQPLNPGLPYFIHHISLLSVFPDETCRSVRTSCVAGMAGSLFFQGPHLWARWWVM